MSSTTTQCTVANANRLNLVMDGNMSSSFWKLKWLNGIGARLFRDRLYEIVASGATGSVTSDAADFFNTITE